MPYVYLVQPVEFINTSCYKVGMSSKEDINRLKSYGRGTEYINYFKCTNYQEAERELINALNDDETVVLFKGREYFCGNKSKILSIFKTVMDKYIEQEINSLEEQELDENVVDDSTKNINQNTNQNLDRDIEEKKQFETNRNLIQTENNTFKCNFCEVSCKFQSEFDRHIKSKKHINKISIGRHCSGCFKQFTTKFNKDRHERSCADVITNNNVFVNTENIQQLNLPTNRDIYIDVKNMKSYVMGIHDLMSDKFTDCLHKLVIHQMKSIDCDIMDFLEEIDKEILKEWTEFNHFHKKECVNSNTTEVCIHNLNNYKLDVHYINKIITNVLLKNKENLVVTHKMITLSGKIKILYKHSECLHDENILKTLLDKSKHVDKFFIEVYNSTNGSKDNKVSLGVELSQYKQVYSILEKKAKEHLTKFNSTK